MAKAKILIQDNTLTCSGDWNFIGIKTLLYDIHRQLEGVMINNIDTQNIYRLDSAGALLLNHILEKLQQKNPDLQITDLTPDKKTLFSLVKEDKIKPTDIVKPRTSYGVFERIGRITMQKWDECVRFLSFIGEFSTNLWDSIWHPNHIRWASVVYIIDEMGYQALPIVALMMFLIGIVLAYQLGLQLENYGADIYIVDVTGIAILREFAPLITSIIMAGRTSTAFAALIGTMRVNQEVDALRTLGLSPMQRLVMPRVFGLVIALPLLVVWADIFGVLGTMVMAKNMAGIGPLGFLQRFKQEVSLRHYVLGVIKAPVFALIIAGVGCFQGFQVELSAESVGQKTTKAAVQAIFLLIVADALFSVLFSWMDL